MYFQRLPHRKKVTDSQAPSLMLDEDPQSKIIKIEVKTLRLQDKTSRQLLVLSDITHILRYEKKKMKDNFSQQLTNSLAHEQLNPLNTIVNVS